jgi:hypothetical protein
MRSALRHLCPLPQSIADHGRLTTSTSDDGIDPAASPRNIDAPPELARTTFPARLQGLDGLDHRGELPGLPGAHLLSRTWVAIRAQIARWWSLLLFTLGADLKDFAGSPLSVD